MQEKLTSLQDGEAEIQSGLDSIKSASPSIGKTLPKSLVSCIVIAFVIIFLIQPSFLKIAMKKVGVTEA
jgi:preprotein translocase subunit SecF